MNKAERIKMVKAMEYIARQINDEEVFYRWLMCGVPDGDIEYGDLTVTPEDEEYLDYLCDDDDFSDLMGTFFGVMLRAAKSGGLYCDGIVDGRTINKIRSEG